MRGFKLIKYLLAFAVCLLTFAGSGMMPVLAADGGNEKAAESVADNLPSELCLGCHGEKGFAAPGADGKMRSLYVRQGKFESSVHGKRQCVECHTDITEIPHQPGMGQKVSCVTCHQKLWETAKKEGKTNDKEFARLGVVVQQIDRFMKSIHARPNAEDQSHTNATCYNCHDAHYIYPAGSPERTEWRLDVPNKCGKCHAAERKAYATSVHGQMVLENNYPDAAICSDCHSTHSVEDPTLDVTRVAITKNCGNCHKDQLETYTKTYHGQVNTLGYGYTAKCFDCHGSHTIQFVSDPRSTVSPENRVNTCRKCHVGATAGFVSFEPHGNSHDRKRFPLMWATSTFMIALLFGVFAFFWLHSALWFYREYKDRKEGKKVPHIVTDGLKLDESKHFRRFHPAWRVAHIFFALSVMMLVLTGTAVLFADATWAKVIVDMFGGPKVTAIVHRVSAAIMLGIFFLHLIYVVIRIGREWKTFNWFGPTSLVPNLKDLEDMIGMFKWFFGQGPRPIFERWTYWEKFDYWAVFWGMGAIGGTGLMLAFPNAVASILPGWVFNIGTIIHGEEAILAAVFLFTVHFFNNHFRPDKHPPPDIVMFTGTQSLEEFRHEHTLEYSRLVASGEINKYLVDAPSRAMTLGSRILGIALIIIGLTLLTLVLIGFIGGA
ncbi:Cytochrome C [Georgfuchsia toluolica]|uniref:Cytochrome C n=1 Tax=Georgfuchsia toluolica TaxID=424218 RepID=A0A916N030_9PROT|nr:cytochrome C [Georgfuchsia toluolica]CAG4883493.1 Cytochrome C [Georgfuchsia toluolica]